MAKALIDSAFHPTEVIALLQYNFNRSSSSSILTNTKKIASWSKSKIRCYEFLNMTSRSFAAVIQELNDELRDAVCLFYLVLRGLDTIEDDMTIPIEKKVSILRSWEEIIVTDGWNFTENGPNEKDRQLLVEYPVVIEELKNLNKTYKEIIFDIAKQMGNGMADYATNAAHNKFGVNTVKDYDQYCFYVAGLVGLGLSSLFSASGLESPEVGRNTKLSISMGLFLQKANIIRDYLEDLDDNRRFWPKEIWSQYVNDLSDLKDPEHKKQAINCLSRMCLDALQRAPDCLTYLSNIRDQKIFNFCAIPQVMAIATLAILFQNYQVYQKNVKIRKGETLKLIQKATNILNVIDIFRHYTRVIITKNNSRDPNFLKISIACGQIEQSCQALETRYKSLSNSKTLNKTSEFNLFDAQLFILFVLLLLVTTGWVLNLWEIWEEVVNHFSRIVTNTSSVDV
ncbi:12116_t:CDS:2 [Ambispora leptoticha]|uniref:Squalene synthase n=1 Tax=Ambispora leptoticha TaxID=144679 RepID=A0A9N8Z809_9GLOM|nr:12116_t:CDS:2 [Ambispora leptoticha]